MKPGSVSYSRIADRYEEVRGGSERARSITAVVAPMLVGVSVLDVGAGTGIVSAELGDAAFRVVPLDFSSETLERCSERFPSTCVRADAAALPVRSESFENVIYVWSLHYVGDALAALMEAFRVLVPRARLVVVWGSPLPLTTPLERSLIG